MDILIFLSEFMVPLTVFYIVGSGILAKRPVFDDFLDGAKEGMRTVADVLPTLIGLMAAVGVLRASGILEALSEFLKFPAALCHIPVPVIPIILVRIVSSSAAVGLILDIFKEYGPGIPIEEPVTYREKREAEKKKRCRREKDEFSRYARKWLMVYRSLLCEAVRTQDRHFWEGLGNLSYVDYLLECLEQCPEQVYADKKAVSEIGKVERRVTDWYS